MSSKTESARSAVAELAATIRTAMDRIPGMDGEFLDYLVDRVHERLADGRSYDCDEYRALELYAGLSPAGDER